MLSALCPFPSSHPLWVQPGLTLTSVKPAVVHGWEGVTPGDGGGGRDRSAAFPGGRSLLRAAPSRCVCLTRLGGPGRGSYGRVPRRGHCHGVVVLVQRERPRDLVGRERGKVLKFLSVVFFRRISLHSFLLRISGSEYEGCSS